MSQSESLFDPTPYTNTLEPVTYGDPAEEILTRLGYTAGEFLDGIRYIEGFLRKDVEVVRYRETEYESEHCTPGYAEPLRDYRYWAPEQLDAEARSFRGYLAGFPVLLDAVGAQEPSLHYWECNSDIDAGNYAIPLRMLDSFYVHSALYTRLQKEIDEIGEYAEPQYQVPLLYEKSSGKAVVYRDASVEDIDKALAVLAEKSPPALVFARRAFGFGTHGRIMDDEQLQAFMKS